MVLHKHGVKPYRNPTYGPAMYSNMAYFPGEHFFIENRICREELKESLGMIFFSPFQPEREFKVYKSCKCSQIICSRVQ